MFFLYDLVITKTIMVFNSVLTGYSKEYREKIKQKFKKYKNMRAFFHKEESIFGKSVPQTIPGSLSEVRKWRTKVQKMNLLQ